MGLVRNTSIYDVFSVELFLLFASKHFVTNRKRFAGTFLMNGGGLDRRMDLSRADASLLIKGAKYGIKTFDLAISK